MSPRSFVCVQCKAIFTTKLKHQTHMKTHSVNIGTCTSGPRKEQMKVVDKKSSLPTEGTASNHKSENENAVLVEHQENGTVDKKLSEKAGYCDKMNTTQQKDKPRRQYKCKKCDTTFNSWATLKRHEAVHNQIDNDDMEDSLEEDVDDIEGDEDYVEGRSANSRIAGLQSIIDKGSSEPGRPKISIKNMVSGITKKRALKKLKYNTAANTTVTPETNDSRKDSLKKAKVKNKKKKDAEVQVGVFSDKEQASPLAAMEVNFCHRCDMKFPDADALGIHMLNHKPKPPVKLHQCCVCKMMFSRKYHLDRHILMTACSGQPPPAWPCQVCGKVYTRKDNLREHLRAHAGEVLRRRKHKCEYCQKQFHGLSLLNIHIRTHTGEKPFKCDFCEKGFPSAGALGKHRRIHTGEKPYSCGDCGMTFTLKGTLNRHMRIHTGVRPHKCKFCGKEFIQIGGLTAHMFYHTGENGFRCETCGKNFNRKARLQMHVRYVHDKVKPFGCDQCEKTFTRKEDLTRHMVLHSGEKPHECPTCLKKFAIKPSLKMHLLTHTKEEPRSCHECGRAFIRKDCLLRHMRKRHRDLLDKILLDEKDQKLVGTGDTSDPNPNNPGPSYMFTENNITESIRELLSLLVDEPTLKSFGWPSKPVDELLESVIRRCGHTPVNPDEFSYIDRLRENAKLLFTVVIDDNAVKTLLNNQTVDEVILHVLRLAKS